MTSPKPTLATNAVHAGEVRIAGSVGMPVFSSVNYLHEGTSTYEGSRYVRLTNTPNHEVLGVKIAVLENAEAAVVTASGMAAISTALLSVLSSGDHLLAINCPYGGTRNFITTDLPRFGIDSTYIVGDDPQAWQDAIRPNTRAIYLESITNPLMQVPELNRAVEFARKHGLVSLIDNTVATPVNFRPCEIGFDLVLHSATKYLNGHGDVAAGAIVGSRQLVHEAHRRLNHLGGILDPHACFLLQRGIKTLDLRVRKQCENAGHIAAFLQDHDAVERVNYPGLPGSSDYERATKLFSGFGGMLSLELKGGVDVADKFIDALAIPIHTVSLGSVETLVIRPAVTAYAGVRAEERTRLGISDRLIRLSIGIEAAEDLIQDLDHALAVANPLVAK